MASLPFSPGADGLAAVLMVAAFGVIWLLFRFRAARAGVGRGAGFGVAAVLGLFLLLSLVGMVAVIIAGPYVIFGAGLLVGGAWQRNRFLIGWAVAVGGIGVFEGFFGITNRLPASLWAAWEHPAIYLGLATATVLAGTVTWLRENRAA